MELPKRKKIRLEGYDYSSNGAYFVTICTRNREILFGNVGADSISARMVENIWHTIVKYCLEMYGRIPYQQIWQRSFHDHTIRIERNDNI